MSYDATVDIPRFYLEDEEQREYFELLSDCHNKIMEEYEGIANVNDYIDADEKYIDLLLKESPFNPPLNLTLEQKRILLKNQRNYLKLRGLHEGIISAVLDLLVLEIFIGDEIIESFCIDFSWIGNDTNQCDDFIGFSDTEMNFTIYYHAADVARLPEILILVDYMKYGPSLYNTIEIP